MSCLAPFTCFLQSTKRIDQRAILHDDTQRQRYASFSCCAYWLVIKHGPLATVTVFELLRFTSSTMIPFLTSFISIDRPSLMETRVIGTKSLVGGHGTAKDGGTNLHKFAEDGETSYLIHHPTWVFASSVHMAHQLQTCWRIHLPFLSSSTIFAQIGISLQWMKRD